MLKHQVTQGDYYLYTNLIETLHLSAVSDVGKKVRTKWKDGTTAYSKKAFGILNEYDLSSGEFPIATMRPTAWKSALKETLWIYQDASNDVKLLEEKYGVKYWADWANSEGNLGRAYGKQIQYQHKYKEGYFNQIDRLIWDLKNNPYSRRMITNLYNHDDLHEMTLYPCAFLTMWDFDGEALNMTLVQRSSDYLVAGSINVANYTLLQHMVAQSVGMKVGMFHHYINNLHTYDRHEEAAKEMLDRYIATVNSGELQESGKTPQLLIDDSVKNFYDFKPHHFELVDYEPMSQVKLEVAL